MKQPGRSNRMRPGPGTDPRRLAPPLRAARHGPPLARAVGCRLLAAVLALALLPGLGGWLTGEGAVGPFPAQLPAQQVVTLPPAGEETDRGWLGIQLVQRADSPYGAPPPGTVRPLSEAAFHVAGIIPGGPGESAGLRAGDRLVHLDGTPVTRETLVRTLRSLRPGDSVRVGVDRAGQEREFVLEATRRPGLLGGGEGMVIALDSIRARVWSNLDSIRAEQERLRARQEGLRMEREQEVRAGARERRAVLLREMSDELVERRVRLDSMMVREHFDLDTLVALFRGSEGERVRSIQILDPHDPAVVRWRKTMRDDAVPALRFRRQPPIPPGTAAPPDGPPVPVLSGFRVVAGAELAPLNPGLAEYFRTERGVLVLSVLDGTPARAAGLQAGDVITHVGDTDINSIPQFRAALARGYRSPPVVVRIVREGTEQRLDFPR